MIPFNSYEIFNGGFEGSKPGQQDNVLSWRETATGEVYAEISVPYGWVAGWDHNQGRPEMAIIKAEAPYLDPPRISEGEYGLKWFTQWRDHDVYAVQTMVVPSRSFISMSGDGHAWYSNYDEAHLSQYGDKDGHIFNIQNGDPGMDLFFGIDPTGQTDPNSETVVWFKYNIYDAPSVMSTSQVVAENPVVALFIRSRTTFPFKHCDVYFDDIEVKLGAPEPEEPQPPEPGTCPKARLDYSRSVLLLHQDTTEADAIRAVVWAYAHDRMSVEWSVDDSMFGPGLSDKTAYLAWFSETTWDRQDIANFRNLWYPTCKLDDVFFFDPGEPPIEPPTDPPIEPPIEPEDWYRWVPYGSAGGFHTDGDRGQSDLARLCMKGGAVYPTAKFIIDVGPWHLVFNASPETPQVLRIIDLPDIGNLESFNSNQDPIWQADVRMQVLMPFMVAARAAGARIYWEVVNEQAPNSPEGWKSFARFFIHCMDIADSVGVKLALFSTSTGEPKIGDMLPDGTVSYDAWEAVASTGLFERMVNTPDGEPHAIAGHAYQLTGDTHQLFRHRYLYDTHILPRMAAIGITKVPPFFMTEYGLPDDYMHNGNDYVWAHWVAFDQEFRKDFYAGGFHTYINGYDDDYNDEYWSLYDRYVQYVIAQKDVPNG